MRLRKPIIAVAAVSAFALAACGGSSSDGNGNGGSSDNTAGNDLTSKAGAGGDTKQTKDPTAVGPATIDGATKGGTVTVLSTSGLNTMDPTEAYYQNTSSILTGLVTRSLTQYKYDAATDTQVLVPDMATDLGTPNADFTEWKFTIKPGLKYEDGTPVKLEDFVFSAARSFDRTAFPEGPAFSNDYFKGADTYKGPYTGKGLDGFDAVTTEGDDTLVYHMDTPFPDMSYWASFAALGPIPNSPDSDPEKYRLHPLATGPYMFGKYVPEKSLELIPNPNWDAASDPARTNYPDKYEFSLQEESAKIDQIMKEDSPSDQATLTYDDILAADFGAINDDGRMSIGSFPLTSYWAPDYRKITDIKVRQALAWAYPYADADLAGGYIKGVTSIPGNTLLPPGTAGREDFDVLPDHTAGETDTDKANALLKEAGAEGYEIKFLYSKDSETSVAVKDTIVASLKKAGFKPVPVPTTTADFSTLRADPATDINVRSAGWIADWPTGASWFPPLTQSTNLKEEGLGSNYTVFSEPTVDARIKEILALPVTEQDAAWGALDKTILTDYFPYFVIRYGGVAQAHGSAIMGHNIDNTIGMPTWKDIWVKS
ncbi:ABC transporter substrate-binding protein [soil metagenome]